MLHCSQFIENSGNIENNCEGYISQSHLGKVIHKAGKESWLFNQQLIGGESYEWSVISEWWVVSCVSERGLASSCKLPTLLSCSPPLRVISRLLLFLRLSSKLFKFTYFSISYSTQHRGIDWVTGYRELEADNELNEGPEWCHDIAPRSPPIPIHRSNRIRANKESR